MLDSTIATTAISNPYSYFSYSSSFSFFSSSFDHLPQSLMHCYHPTAHRHRSLQCASFEEA